MLVCCFLSLYFFLMVNKGYKTSVLRQELGFIGYRGRHWGLWGSTVLSLQAGAGPAAHFAYKPRFKVPLGGQPCTFLY